MGFLDSLFGSESESEVKYRPLSKQERELQKILLERVREADPLFSGILGSAVSESGLADQIIGREFDTAQAFNRLFRPEDEAARQFENQLQADQLGRVDSEILGRILKNQEAGPNATPEQLERIRGAADLALESGLSDIGRFREDTFENIRRAAAGRGLRPSDTPIVNQLTESGEEFGRQATQLARAIRASQIGQELDLPFRNAALDLGQLGAASDLATRRRAFEASLSEAADAQRLGLAGISRGQLQGLVTGAYGPQSALASLPQRQVAGSESIQHGNLGSLLSAVASSYAPSGGGGGAFGLGSIFGGGGGSAAGGAAGAAGGAAGSAAGSAGSAAGSGASAAGSGIGSAFSWIGSLFSSDERGKEEIEEIEASRLLDDLPSYRFFYKDPAKGGGPQIGVMAQDLERIGLGSALVEDEEGALWVDSTKIAGPTLAFVSDLNKRLRALEEQAHG